LREVLEYLGLGFAPGLFFLYYAWRRDHYRLEPPHMMLRVFGLGAIAVVPAAITELGFERGYQAVLGAHEPPVLVAAFLAAIPEEGWKLVAVYLGAYLHRHFDERVDGMIYGAAAALGFASVENVLYILRDGPSVMWLRSFTATLAHVGFTGILGLHLGRARFDHEHEVSLVLRGFLLAVLLHAAYDLLVLVHPAFSWLAFPFVGGMALYLSHHVDHAIAEHMREEGRPPGLLP
jgi:RsiW-degrading membrane proteinase PrsW (M82 family)